MEEHHLICITCQGKLDLSPNTCVICSSCGKSYPKILGIPDLRKDLLPITPLEEKVLYEMVKAFPNCDFKTLLELSVSAYDIPNDIITQYKNYFHGQNERGSKMIEMFYNQSVNSFGSIDHDIALDIGCGAGSSLSFLSPLFQQIYGIDINIISLILAKKYIEENGLTNITLIRAQADTLPFYARTFHLVTTLNTLDHVFKIKEVVGEIFRVLNNNGIFVGDSRNRYDLFFPEPHVHIRWVGFFPRSWAKRYVKLRTSKEYEDAFLFSYGDLKRNLHFFFEDNFIITFPETNAYGYSQKLDQIIRVVKKVPLLRTILLFFFPSHLIMAKRAPEKS